MKIICHRGNTDGPNKEEENTLSHINKAIKSFDVEIDVRLKDGKLWLGHDTPQEEASVEWINSNKNKLWIHCKDIESLNFLRSLGIDLNFFGHENDGFVLTSKNYIFALPSEAEKIPSERTIFVMPEFFKYNKDIKRGGVLTDYPLNYV
tara:strand:- start:6392 stop:6838 length:447 start_codon:yes stop_codon:yes gene_type:complete